MANTTQSIHDILSGTIQPFRTMITAHRALTGLAVAVLGIGWVLHELMGYVAWNPVWVRVGLMLMLAGFLVGSYVSDLVRQNSKLIVNILLVLLNIWILCLNVVNLFPIQFLLGSVFVYLLTAVSFSTIRNLTRYLIVSLVITIGGAILNSSPDLPVLLYISLIALVFIGVYVVMYLRVFAQNRFDIRTEIYSAIFNDSDVALFLLNPDTLTIDFGNGKTQELFGLAPETLKLKPMHINEVIPVQIDGVDVQQFFEIPLHNFNGDVFWADVFVKPFETNDIRFLLIRIVDVTSRKGVEETVERMAAQRRRLLEISKSLLNTLDLKQIVNTMADVLSTVTDYQLMVLYWRDGSSRVLRPIAWRNQGWTEFNVENHIIPTGRGIASRVMQSGEAVLINEAHLDPESFYPGDQSPDVEQLIVIPVKIHGESTGVFTISRIVEKPFSADEFELIQLLVNQSTAAIQNSILFEEANRRTRHSQSLMAVAKAINSTMQRDQLLNLIVEKVLEITNSVNGALFLVNEQTHELVLVASRGFLVDRQKPLTFRIGESIAGWAAESGTGVMIHDVENHPRFLAIDQKEHFTSMISIPLKLKDSVVGVLGVDRLVGEKYFTEREFQIAQDFAEQAVLALENARLFEQMQVSEKKYRTLFEELDDAVFVVSPAGRFIDINPAGIRMFGYSDLADMRSVNIWEDMYADTDHRDGFIRQLAQVGHIKNMELSFRRKDGSPVTILLSSNIVRDSRGRIQSIHGTMKDITEQKRFQQQLFQSQKMESIGQLAGGMAHDFNNILSGIMGYASFMKQQLEPENPQFRYASAIENAANRAADLISQLLAFARGIQSNQIPVNMNAIIDDTLRIIERTFEKRITLVTELDSGLPQIMGDPVQLQQVVLNLAVNARDAITGNGTITIQTSRKTLFANPEYPELAPGEYVVIHMTDTGMGMSDEVRKRIFEPFFTTKQVGKGTGLGLAMAYGVVKSHSGFIQVKSAPGEGSSFTVYLPAHLAELPSGQPVTIPEPEIISPTTSSMGRILVVDDDPSIRSLISDILTHYGYQVVHATNGLEAIEQVDEHGLSIRLIILDIMMPQMNGVDGYHRIIRKYPGMKVIFSSGYSQSELLDGLTEQPNVRFLPKPYHVNELLELVRTMVQD